MTSRGIITLLLGAALLVFLPARQASAVGNLFDAFGLDAGGEPRVKVYVSGAEQVADLLAFDAAFRGGVRVAVGDVDGDGIDDIIAAAGPGGGPHVKVFPGICIGTYTPTPFPDCSGTFSVDTVNVIASFFAFDAAFSGGVFVAAGNFDQSNDATTCQRHEIAVGAGEGAGPHVKVFRNATVGGDCPLGSPVAIDPAAPIVSFFPYQVEFTGGVRVAAADLNSDGFADLVTGAGPGGGPHVQVFANLSSSPPAFDGLDTASPVASFFAFGAGFTGGVYVGTANAAFSPSPDLVVGAGSGGGPHVVVVENTNRGLSTAFGFDLATAFASFFAFDATFTGGVRVSSMAFYPFNLLAVPGPGGPNVAKAIVVLDGVPTETMFGAAPFGFSTLGAFPSQ